VLLLLAVAALGAAGLAVAAAAPGDEVLPDLVADAPMRATLQTYSTPEGARLLLRFDGYIHNLGRGALDVRGSDPVDGVMAAVQRVYTEGGGFVDHRPAGATGPRVIFETDDDHDHWHLRAAARYSLWNAERTGEVAPAMKVGFCLEDSERREVHGPLVGVYTDEAVGFCQAGNPGATSVYMGVSAGWRDVYGSHLAFQWIDVSNVQPGDYWLRAEVDPEGVLIESDESNNTPRFASTSSRIPGWLSQPLTATIESPSGEALTLPAQAYGSPGPRGFTIVTGPTHGTLDASVGGRHPGSSVTYVPDPGYTGQDGFSYRVFDLNSPFPTVPQAATAVLQVGETTPRPTPRVDIVESVASVQTGTSAQFAASRQNVPDDLVWSVSGVDGGSASLGTISPTGLYSAPAAVPPGGTVTIGVRSASVPAASDTAPLQVVAPPDPEPAPDPPPPPPPSSPPTPAATPPPAPAAPPPAVQPPVGTTPPTTPPLPVRPPTPPPPAIQPPSGTTPPTTIRPPATRPSVRSPLSGLGRVTVVRGGRFVYVKVTPRRAGVVSVTARVGRRRLARCRIVSPAGRAVTCRLSLAHDVVPSAVRLVIDLRSRGGTSLGLVRARVR